MNISHTFTRFLLISLSIFYTFAAQGQGFNKTYDATHGNCQDMTQANDGGYFMTGVFQGGDVQKVNGSGIVLWTAPNALNGASGIAICKAPDGGCVVLGQNFADTNGLKSIVVKIDPSGVKEWQLVVDNNLLPNGLKDIVPTNDGGYMLSGDTRDNQLKQDVWLVKVSASGTVLWNKSFGFSTLDEQVAEMIASSDGTFVIFGTVLENTNDPNFFIAKADADGNLIWQKKYNKPGYQIAYDLVQTSDGGFVLLGDTYQNEPVKITVVKTDIDGNELWFIKLDISALSPDQNIHVVQSIARDNADNLYIPINKGIDFVENPDFFLLKLDPQGNSIDYFNLGTNHSIHRIILTDDNHLAIAGGDEIFRSFLIKTDLDGLVYSNKVIVHLFDDQNDNCQKESGEAGLDNFILEARNAQNESFFQNLGVDGTYTIRLPEGDFQIIVHAPSGRPDFWAPCDTPDVTVTGINQTITLPDIGIRTLIECPYLEVDLATGLIRRCSTAVYSVHYCNSGNLPATNASVQLTINPLLSYESSSIPLSGQNGDVLTFNIPDVLLGDCETFYVYFNVSCDADLGQTICAEAHIFPDSSCLTPGVNWDGSQIEVTGTCNGDVQFRIHNIGAGNMAEPSAYVILEDQIMYLGSFKLKSGEDTTFTFPNPPPHAYYLRADQSPGAPVFGDPAVVVQDCGSTSPFNLLALQLPLDQSSPFISVFCDNVVGSFDPNDKRGFPMGRKDEHFIDPGQDIQYMIRFQNTGTDTAFTVVIRDPVSPLLDLGSVIPGPSSHPYTWEIKDGRILTFRFPGIQLPDSNINEVASHGYVTFRIKQAPDLPLGTVIENNAGIYFDFNDPVQTNTCFHTIGQDLLTTTVTHEQKPGSISLEVFPNPFTQETLFRLGDMSSNNQLRLTLYDLTGKQIREERFSGTEHRFLSKGLLPGIYLFRLEDNDGKTVSGKVTVQR